MSVFYDEWCEYANDIRITAGARQDIVVEQEVTHFDGWAVANKPQQQPNALNFLHRPNDALLTNLRFPIANILQKIFSLDGFNNGDDSCRGERAAAKCRTQVTASEMTRDVFGAQHCATRNTAPQCLGARENVGFDPEGLHGKKLARASDA